MRKRRTRRGRGTSSVRIGAGRWRGRALEVPPAARPTAGRAREALFDLLSERIGGARVLDLYAGSGAVGLEALSRGASRVCFVEEDADPVARNLERLGASEPEAVVRRERVERAAAALLREEQRFDLVFCDPPYGAEWTAALAATVGELLAPGGLLVVQRDAGEAIAHPASLRLDGRRAYGRNVFFFFSAVASRAGGPGTESAPL